MPRLLNHDSRFHSLTESRLMASLARRTRTHGFTRSPKHDSWLHSLTESNHVLIAHSLPELMAHELTSLNRCKTTTHPFFQVGDNSLVALSSHMPGLQTLLLANCVRVSDIGIMAVAEGCTSLVSVDLNGCAGVTPEAMEALIRASRERYRKCVLGQAGQGNGGSMGRRCRERGWE